MIGGLPRPKPFVRPPVKADPAARAAGVRWQPVANNALKSASQWLNASCAKRQAALGLANAKNPNFLGSVNTESLLEPKRYGASQETLVYRHPLTGSTGLVEVVRPGPRGGAKLPPLMELSHTEIKNDGRVFKDNKLITPRHPLYKQVTTQLEDLSRSVDFNVIRRWENDINNKSVRMPWANRGRLPAR